MKKFLEKHLIIHYVVSAYVKYLIFSAIFFAAAYGLLMVTNVYPRMERVLDLKYNSPFVVIPIYGTVALAILCGIVGFLMYFYKYKRSKSRSTFSKVFSSVLNAKQTDM